MAQTKTTSKTTDKRFYATGRRKESSARVWISKGKGEISVNGKTLEDYFKLSTCVSSVHQPFSVTKTSGSYDVFATVKGGGTTGQAEAIRHGISRALCLSDEELRTLLRKNGLLTRDSREVERKKYGRRKARRSRQFSKR